MRNKILLIALVSLLAGVCQAQKKYEMVIEKTNGSNVVVNTKDVIRTYFREIADSPEPSYTSCPDDHHPHLIDLGLPSGTKWACCNVGADKPEDYGGYYAWGETEEKRMYTWGTYLHCDGSYETCHDLASDIAGTQYDVAHVKWGGSWVMPSLDQFEELLDNCTYEWTTINGVMGGKFTGKNGGTVFLPAAGNHYHDGLNPAGSGGYYWSSTQDPSSSAGAYSPHFYSGGADWRYNYWNYGQSVRPVSR